MNCRGHGVAKSQTRLVAQMVKHLPTMRGTRVRSLHWEDPLEKEMATHSSILVWKIPWTEKPGWLLSTGCKESDTTERLHCLLLSLGLSESLENACP